MNEKEAQRIWDAIKGDAPNLRLRDGEIPGVDEPLQIQTIVAETPDGETPIALLLNAEIMEAMAELFDTAEEILQEDEEDEPEDEEDEDEPEEDARPSRGRRNPFVP